MKLNFKSYGDSGDTVLIMHGIFGMLDNWHSFASQLSKEFRVITIDLRNHGRSPHSEKFDYPDMVKDLKNFIKDHKLEKIHLVGHSMGGKVAMHFALQHPDTLNSLTVLDIGIKYYPPKHDYIFNALCGLELSEIDSRNQIDEILSGQIKSFAIRQFLIKNIKRKEKNCFEWKMNLPVIRANYDRIIDWIPTGKAYWGRTLFVKGAESNYIEEEDWQGIQEIFPNAVLKTIKGAGHWLHAEKPYDLLKKIKKFIGKTS